MAANALALKDFAAPDAMVLPTRAEVIARYRHLRAICSELGSRALELVSHDALMQNARRLGLVGARQLLCDSKEMQLAIDLSLNTAETGRSRAIDRFARSAKFEPGSDEALMLDAMCRARFTFVQIQRHHDVAGLVVKDAFSGAELWLVDEAMESSMSPGCMLATRIATPDQWSMTLTISLPIDRDLLDDTLATAGAIGRKTPAEAVGDRRFAQALYRAAIGSNTLDNIVQQNPGDNAN